MICKAPLPASDYYKVEFLYQPDGEGEFLTMMKKSWWFDATSTNLGFITDSGGRLPKIVTFRDQRTPMRRNRRNDRHARLHFLLK